MGIGTVICLDHIIGEYWTWIIECMCLKEEKKNIISIVHQSFLTNGSDFVWMYFFVSIICIVQSIDISHQFVWILYQNFMDEVGRRSKILYSLYEKSILKSSWKIEKKKNVNIYYYINHKMKKLKWLIIFYKTIIYLCKNHNLFIIFLI